MVKISGFAVLRVHPKAVPEALQKGKEKWHPIEPRRGGGG